MRTLLLDRGAWDLVIGADGNIAVASDPYSKAQDAASAIRLFVGDDYYDKAAGIPYFEQILGHAPPLNYMRQKFIDAAMSVPGVIAAKVFFSSIKGRKVSGQVQVTDTAGSTSATTF